MKQEDFESLRNQIIEVFPTEEADYLYEPHHRSEKGKPVSARGRLYNHYKYIRKQLFHAGLLAIHEEDDEFDGNLNSTVDENTGSLLSKFTLCDCYYLFINCHYLPF